MEAQIMDEAPFQLVPAFQATVDGFLTWMLFAVFLALVAQFILGVFHAMHVMQGFGRSARHAPAEKPERQADS
jgi:hypothetical protein